MFVSTKRYIMRKTLFAFYVFTLLSTSCKKDKDDLMIPTEATLRGNYKLTMYTENGVNVFNNPNESLNYYEECERDDIHILRANGIFDYIDLSLLCSGSNNWSSTWSLTSN